MKHATLLRRSGLSALLLTGILSSGVMAADAVPTTAPAIAVAAAGVRATPRVEIFAFTPVNKTDASDWIGRGIQENLQSDVSRTGATLVLPAHAPPASEEPLTTARQDHADLAVIGTYQVVGDQIRVNAHLMDLASNTAVGGFAATGSQHDLFKVEDALGEQLRSLLPRPVVADQTAPATPAPAVAPATYYTPPPVANYYESVPDYYPDYGYSYPYYSYGYPFGFYGGIGIYSGGYYNRGYYGGVRGNPGFHGGVGGGVRGGGGGFHGGVGGGHGGGGRR